MKELLSKIKYFFRYQQVRFLFVGLLNTIVGYGSYVILIFFNINYLLANFISTVIGIVNSYIWNRNFTFKSNKKIKIELIKFLLVYFIIYLIGLINLFIMVSYFKTNKYLAGFINLIVTTIISWIGHKHFSFKNEFN